MIQSVQQRLNPCLADERVFSFQTACNEILKNVFTTERGFDHQDESRYDDDDDSSSCCSIFSDATPKTKNSPSPVGSSSPAKQVVESTVQKFQDFVTLSDRDISETQSLIFTAENAAELQYRCNRRAQSIQRAYERGVKSSKDHRRHLRERYGNRAIELHYRHES